MIPAKLGDRFRFEHPNEPQFDCDLIVVQVCGDDPDDLVFFNDGTHSKQRNLATVPRLPTLPLTAYARRAP